MRHSRQVIFDCPFHAGPLQLIVLSLPATSVEKRNRAEWRHGVGGFYVTPIGARRQRLSPQLSSLSTRHRLLQ
jgi:hypothetical protein